MACYLNCLSKSAFSPLRFQRQHFKRSHNSKLKSILQLFGFTQVICTQTRITGDMESLIDIIASNNCASIKDITLVPCNISDNQLIECVGKLNQMKFLEKTITRKYYRSYDPAKRKRSEVNLNIWKISLIIPEPYSQSSQEIRTYCLSSTESLMVFVIIFPLSYQL